MNYTNGVYFFFKDNLRKNNNNEPLKEEIQERKLCTWVVIPFGCMKLHEVPLNKREK